MRFLLPCLLFAPLLSLSAQEKPLRFNFDVRPLLSDRCFFCHGPDAAKRKGELRLDTKAGAMGTGKSGRFAIVPGKPEESELIRRIDATDPDDLMPPADSHLSLSAVDRETLRRWIAEGAPYEAQWAWQTPVKAEPPVLPGEEDPFSNGEIDQFLFAAAAEAQVPLSSIAAPATRLRRASLTLTGLPATREETEAFLADPSPRAWGAAIERLLASPAFAERLALDWLDAARFADTYGYQADRPNHLWPWRDWVLRAFQTNLPYDQFLTQQIAGDLLPDATPDQVLATAFNRLHRMTNEGGSVAEEFRIEGVADRVNTLGSAVLGLTLECSRCHDHKYDPLTTKEYWSLGAFFENIDEYGVYAHFNDAEPTPSLTLFQPGTQEKHAALLAEIAAAEKELAQIAAAAAAEVVSAVPPGPAPEPVDVFTFDTDAPKFASAANDKHFLTKADAPASVPGKSGQAAAFDGDNGLNGEGGVAAFSRTDPFTFSLWIEASKYKPGAMILHRSQAEQDAALQGWQLTLDDGRPSFSLIHFWPGNAVRITAHAQVPLKTWVHLAVSSDGSGRAAGLRIYVNGEPQECTTVRDCLTRDIGGANFGIAQRFRDTGFAGGALDELRIYDLVLTPSEVRTLAGSSAPPDAADGLTARLRDTAGPWRECADRLTKLRRDEQALLAAQPAIMVMQEMPEPRKSYLRVRGAYDAPGDEVHPGVPASLPPLPAGVRADRLALARWLTSPEQPLTARVYVNRIWQLFFGRGLVATTNDLGSQGRLPTHPELLDWLARDFMDHGWDVRRLCRQIALSTAFQLSASPAPGQQEADPGNRYLARYPRHRLPAELIRDSALAVSGLLVQKTGGPSVRPYQPPGLWEESGTGASYSQGNGEALYRRSLYGFIKRTAPPANLSTFDSTSREVCTVKRETTNTPLQALVLLNDVQFTEAARVFAQRALAAHPDNAAARTDWMVREALGRPASEAELAILTRLLDSRSEALTHDPDKAAALLKTGESPVPADLPAIPLAATAAVAQVLLNSDEFVNVP